MADDLRTVLQFVGDAKDAQAVIEGLVTSLRKAAADTKKLFEDFARGPATPPKLPTPDFDKPKNDALAYAQALARLRSAEGDLAGAQKTLAAALEGTSKDTLAAVRAQTQLVGIESQLSTAAGKAETAILREAQAMARLQQISGNTPAAIKTLEDALARVGNRSSLPALRAELQKAYLDTNYANSPLISAIDRVNAGLRLASPLLGGAAGNLSQLITVSANAASAIANTGRGLDQGSKSAANFASSVGALRGALRNFLGDQGGQASLSLGLSNIVEGIGRIDFSNLRQQAAGAFSSIRGGALSAAEGIGRLSLGLGLAAATLTGILAIGAAGFFGAIGGRALEAAKEVDAARQSIAALVGGADAANDKIAELRKLAQESPGVTTGLATTLFTQLKASSDIADASINEVIKSVGKLNAVFTIDDPKGFSRNLIQIFSQGFERADIKEALGRVPIFEQFLEQAFGTKDGARLRALKDSGKLTLEGFLTGLSDAINNDSRFANIRESLGAKLAKASERFSLALAPIGDQIGEALLPLFAKIQPAIESAVNAIANALAQAQFDFKLLTDVAGEFLGALGDIAGQAGFSFDLQTELRAVAQIIEFVTGGVRLLQDVVEIAAASALFAIKGVTLAIESGLAGVLDLVGIKVQSLEEDMKRLRDEVVPLFDRIEQGLKNTRQFNAGRKFDSSGNPIIKFVEPGADGVVDFGNAVTERPKAPPPRSFGGGGSSKGKSDAAARAAREEARADLAIARQKEAAVDLAARRDLENLRRSLTDRLISQEQFAELTIRVEQDLLTAKLDLLRQEEEAAVRATKSKAAAEAKRAEFALKKAKELQEADLRIEGLRDDVRRTQEKAEEDHQRRLADIREIGRRSITQAIDEQVRLNQISEVEGAERQIDLERERFKDREVQLQRELELARENVDEKRRINDELAKLAAERAAFELEASGRIQDAIAREAVAFTSFIRSRVSAIVDLRRAEIESAAARTSLNLQRGAITERQAQESDFERRREIVRIESLERERQIEQQAQQLAREAAQARLGAATLLQIEQQKNASLKAERDRAAAERQALEEQQRAVSLTPAFGEEAALAIAGLEAALGRQLTLWEQNRVAVSTYAADLKVLADDAWARATNVLGVFTDALSASIDAFVESGGSLKAAGKALVKGLAAPFIEAAKTKAKFEAAEALASLAVFDFRGALLHGLAAAGFAALAGLGTALVNGGSGGGGRKDAQRSEGGQQINREERVINQGGPLPTQQPTTIRIRLERGLIAETFEEDFQNNGRTRAVIRRDVAGE